MKTYIYLSKYSDEHMPCECTLSGWAEWLSKPDEDWHRDAPATDGETFEGHCNDVTWHLAVVSDGQISYDPPLPAVFDFLAVAHGEGLGWFAENMHDSLDGLESDLLDDGTAEEIIACSISHQAAYTVTYRMTETGPVCTAAVNQ